VMKRRVFLIGSAAFLVAPRFSLAQQTDKLYRIGLFHVGLDHVPPSLDGLREGLRSLGYDTGTSPAPITSTIITGKNIRLDWRNLPDESAARLTAQAFVRDRVDLVVAFENQTVRAAREIISDIPVVFLHVRDPVADGFVTSMARPGGNLTGFAGVGNVPAKELALFKEMVPGLRRLLVLSAHGDPASGRWLTDIRKVGTTLKLRLDERVISDETEAERLFRSLKEDDVDGVFPASPDLRVRFMSLLLRLAYERRLPMVGPRKEWVAQGALFCYADNVWKIGRAAASRYIDRILKGAKPRDLPVEEVSEYELVINLKTAKALGLTIPPSVLARADQLIE
jgi:putative tryptophan/tyrosine transport system substrate-binding protein